ncbi:hypothetical protein [Streptococcus jiangjianxini]|uniref:hypothetical protein n=1 Tax=Streptococcus jiangjianxini TaxID=3161189 RepID=UPI0032ED1AB0
MKKRVKLRRKPLTKWIFLLPLLLGLIPILLIILHNQIKQIFNPSYQVSEELYRISVYILLFCLLISICFSPFLRFWTTRHQLKKILFTNNYFSVNDTTGEVIYSSEFVYYKKNNKLFVEFHPNGLKNAKQMNDLQPILETALKLYVEEVDDSKPSFTTYVMSYDNGGNRIDVSSKW